LFFLQDEARVSEARLWIEAVTGESFSNPGDQCFLFPFLFLFGQICVIHLLFRCFVGVILFLLLLSFLFFKLCIIILCDEKDDFHNSLKDGVLLCALLNAIKPGTIPEKKINKSKMPFKCMENITAFIKASRELGVPEPDLFETQDLWGAKVCVCVCVKLAYIYILISHLIYAKVHISDF